MSKGIRVSEKHGVNPSLGVCAWCHQEDGTVVLVGRLPNDQEAPRRAIYTNEPCDGCRAMQARGITITAHDSEGNWTGSWSVVTEEAIKKLITPPELVEQILRTRKAACHKDLYDRIFSQRT